MAADNNIQDAARMAEIHARDAGAKPRLMGRQWCGFRDHWFVPAFGHGDGELIDMEEETFVVCAKHEAEARAYAAREAL